MPIEIGLGSMATVPPPFGSSTNTSIKKHLSVTGYAQDQHSLGLGKHYIAQAPKAFTYHSIRGINYSSAKRTVDLISIQLYTLYQLTSFRLNQSSTPTLLTLRHSQVSNLIHVLLPIFYVQQIICRFISPTHNHGNIICYAILLCLLQFQSFTGLSSQLHVQVCLMVLSIIPQVPLGG
jgi:hypothetical protein